MCNGDGIIKHGTGNINTWYERCEGCEKCYKKLIWEPIDHRLIAMLKGARHEADRVSRVVRRQDRLV